MAAQSFSRIFLIRDGTSEQRQQLQKILTGKMTLSYSSWKKDDQIVLAFAGPDWKALFGNSTFETVVAAMSENTPVTDSTSLKVNADLLDFLFKGGGRHRIISVAGESSSTPYSTLLSTYKAKLKMKILLTNPTTM